MNDVVLKAILQFKNNFRARQQLMGSDLIVQFE